MMEEQSSLILVLLAAFLFLSIALELIIARARGFKKKKELLAVLLVNLITKPTLCILIYASVLRIFSLDILRLCVIAAAILIIEWRLLVYTLEEKPMKMFSLTLSMTLLSLFGSLAILILLRSIKPDSAPHKQRIIEAPTINEIPDR